MKHRVWIVFLFSLAVCVACQHSGKEDMRLRLDYVSRCNRADTVFTEAWLPRVDSLVTYFDRHGNANERMMAHYLQGRVYHDMGEAPQALECYQTATEQADTTREDCDLYTLYAVYGQMAKLYHSQYLPDDEMKAIKTAERIAWKDKDTLSALIAFGLRARPYSLRNDTDSILFSERKTFELLRNYGCKDLASQFLLGTFDILLCKNRIDEIRVLMNIYEKESGMFDHNDTITQGLEVYYYEKGRYLLAVGKRDSALLYFHKALEGQTEAAYKGILSVYKEKGISDSIAKYAELFAAANDSSFLHVNQERIRQISAMYDYNRIKQIADKHEIRNKQLWILLLLMLFSFVLILSVSTSIYRYNRRKNISRIRMLQNRVEKAKRVLCEKQYEIDNIQHDLKDEILHLNGTNDSLNELLLKRQEEKKEMLRQIEEYRDLLAQYKSSDKLKAFYNSDIYNYFHSFNEDSNHGTPATDKDWSDLLSLFQEFFPTYYSFIREENKLTKDQLRVCVLLKLAFSTYEMSKVLGVDGDRITRVKAQANKNLFKDNKARTLDKNMRLYFQKAESVG